MSRASAALSQALKAFEAAHPGWDHGLLNPNALSAPHYIGSAAEDGREMIDYAQPVSASPKWIRDEAGVLQVNAAHVASKKKYCPYASVAPAPLPQPGDDLEHDLEDAEEERRATIRAAILSRYDGDHADVLEALLDGLSLAAIAVETCLTWRRVHQIIRGNPQRRGEEEGLNGWLTRISGDLSLEAVVAMVEPAPVTVEPVHTLKKSLQSQAPLGQLAWDMDALMGVAA